MILKTSSVIYRWLLITLCVVMFLIVGYNVFSRYVLNNSLGWADELARFIFVWVSFLGAVSAYEKGEHVGLDFVVQRIPWPLGRRLVKLAGELGILLVLVCLAGYGFVVAMSATNVSPALYIPMRIVYMIVPVTASLMVLINLVKIKDHCKTLAKRA